MSSDERVTPIASNMERESDYWTEDKDELAKEDEEYDVDLDAFKIGFRKASSHVVNERKGMFWCRRIFYEISISRIFHMFIALCIIVNTVLIS